ncbi:MAG: helix-turn-helix domain-containing protein [Verrucomicrobia bacterium]|nr:MAG: helix-turn-helix domain-containing protein [Verrucomicrobiota bacterium]TAE87226.1 MAG: helix-turn-helix domain-containing protein [Verrucomicrobiota bacterium]TAF25062.1 MAG: helix-turn-helix domain-containing protein [Verrucomicrobiota bacterium]
MKNQFRQVGLMVDPLSGYGSKILDGISRYAQQKPNWRVAYFDRERSELAELVGGWQGDGLICTVVDQRFHDAAASRSIPVVNVAGLLNESEIVSVLSEDEEIGRMAAEHLLDRGFTHFTFIRRRDGSRYSQDRGNGFRKRIERSGSKVTTIQLPANHSEADLIARLAALPRPLGVFASLDRIGALVLEACWNADFKVPEEVAIIGAGNHNQLCGLCTPTLSSVEVDMERRGYEAAALLDRLIEGEAPPREPVRIPPAHVVERRSTDVFAFSDPNVVAALRFIREHADTSIKARDVVAATSISRRSLEGRFNMLIGRTLHEEIWRAHFDLAMRLLASSDLSLQEVAERSGFRTASALVNLFRQRLGVTPKEYRVSNRR